MKASNRDSLSKSNSSSYNPDLAIQNVLNCLGAFPYDSMFDLTGAILNGDEQFILQIIDNYYNNGTDLNLFIEQYLDFTLDLTKYCLFKDISLLKIPNNLQDRCAGFANITKAVNIANALVEKVLEIKNMIKRDANCKTTIEAMFIKICREPLI